jgi:hypothetical protein
VLQFFHKLVVHVTDMAKKLGIKCVSFENAPGFKLGDGEWGMNTPEGLNHQHQTHCIVFQK